MKPDELNSSIAKLKSYVEEKNFSGYDIYDGLEMTRNRFILNNRITNTLITQLFKKSPINIRPLVGIRERTMPKSIGLFLNAYSTYYSCLPESKEKKDCLDKIDFFIKWLDEHKLNSYSGACWNFGFKYKFMFDNPTGVITSIIAKGLHEAFLSTADVRAKELLLSIEAFILNDLHVTSNAQGICFSYTPLKKDACYNASLLAAETLARIYSITRNEKLLSPIQDAVRFVIAHQKEDGRWNYSIDLVNCKEKKQVDFHQGYNLESMYNIMQLCGLAWPELQNSILLGSEFYMCNQWFENGKSKWRIPNISPVDIHNQAQGIIYFSQIKHLDEKYLSFANKIADWTILNMQRKEGWFIYQIHNLYSIKIPYMRWAQAWMLLALVKLKRANTQ